MHPSVTRIWLELEWDGANYHRVLVVETDIDTLEGRNSSELDDVMDAAVAHAHGRASKVRIVPAIGYNA